MPATAAAPVRLAFIGAGARLAVGTPVQVEIEAETHTDVVLVPVGAVVREGEETAVFVAAERQSGAARRDARHLATARTSK